MNSKRWNVACSKRWKLAFGACALLASIVACASARRGESVAPPMQLSETATRGELVFMERCNKCHPGGEAGLGPSLNEKALPRFMKRWQVREGFGVMPSFSEELITSAQLDDLMDYLSELRSHPSDRG